MAGPGKVETAVLPALSAPHEALRVTPSHRAPESRTLSAYPRGCTKAGGSVGLAVTASVQKLIYPHSGCFMFVTLESYSDGLNACLLSANRAPASKYLVSSQTRPQAQQRLELQGHQ